MLPNVLYNKYNNMSTCIPFSYALLLAHFLRFVVAYNSSVEDNLSDCIDGPSDESSDSSSSDDSVLDDSDESDGDHGEDVFALITTFSRMCIFLRTGVVAFFAAKVAFCPFLITTFLVVGFNPVAFPAVFTAKVAARGFLTTIFLPASFDSTRLAATLLPATLPAAFCFIDAFFFWMMMSF